MKILRVVGASAAMVLAVTFLGVEGRGQMDAIGKIRSSNLALQKEGGRELLQQRKELISSLINILKQGDKNAEGEKRSSLVAAIDVLGEMRAIEAVDILVDYIKFPASDKLVVFYKIIPPSEIYPAVKALIKIGKPSLPAVLRVLKESTDEKDVILLTNSGWIISQVLGHKIGKIYLEDALQSETDPKKRARIEDLLNLFKEN